MSADRPRGLSSMSLHNPPAFANVEGAEAFKASNSRTNENNPRRAHDSTRVSALLLSSKFVLVFPTASVNEVLAWNSEMPCENQVCHSAFLTVKFESHYRQACTVKISLVV